MGKFLGSAQNSTFHEKLVVTVDSDNNAGYICACKKNRHFQEKFLRVEGSCTVLEGDLDLLTEEEIQQPLELFLGISECKVCIELILLIVYTVGRWLGSVVVRALDL